MHCFAPSFCLIRLCSLKQGSGKSRRSRQLSIHSRYRQQNRSPVFRLHAVAADALWLRPATPGGPPMQTVPGQNTPRRSTGARRTNRNPRASRGLDEKSSNFADLQAKRATFPSWASESWRASTDHCNTEPSSDRCSALASRHQKLTCTAVGYSWSAI